MTARGCSRALRFLAPQAGFRFTTANGGRKNRSSRLVISFLLFLTFLVFTVSQGREWKFVIAVKVVAKVSFDTKAAYIVRLRVSLRG
jgi:hypothetical protein